MKRIVLVLFVMLVMVALLAPMAQAQAHQSVAGKYSCLGPPVIVGPDDETAEAIYEPLSKKEAEEGLASGTYASCTKILPSHSS